MRDHIETAQNLKGMCVVSSDNSRAVLACPDKIVGRVRVMDYTEEKQMTIEAHTSSISALGINTNGSLLATASDKGTLIRIFNLKNGLIQQELRRGIDRAEIYCLAFSYESN